MQYTLSPSAMYDEIVECTSNGLVPYTRSSPGLGKTSLHGQIAKDYNLKLIDISVATATPEDFMGFPMANGDKATFRPFDHFPIEGDPIPKGYDGFMLFFDEFSSGSKAIQASAYKLVLSRYAGSYKLHDRCVIACAGNREIDNAVVTKLSTAMQTRLIHYEMVANVEDWVKWATAEGLDYRVISFVEYMPKHLTDFDPNHTGQTFSCPRTLAFLGQLMKGKEISSKLGPRIAGTIGTGAAIDFIGYAAVFEKISKYGDIIRNPTSTPVPTEMSMKFATVSMLAQRAKEEDLDSILTYIKRFALEMQIVFMRKLVITEPTFRYKHKGFGKYLIDMMEYLA